MTFQRKLIYMQPTIISLGGELDFKFKIKFKEYVKLEGGYAFMQPTQSMSVIKGGDHHEYNSWAYVMLTIDPVFFRKE